VRDFLKRNDGFERVPVTVDELGGLSECIDAQGDLRTLPSNLGGTTPGQMGGLDGFFASRLRRTA